MLRLIYSFKMFSIDKIIKYNILCRVNKKFLNNNNYNNNLFK